MAKFRFLYEFAKFPKDQQLLEDVNNAADRLHQKLSNFDVKSTGISPYNQEYFGGLLNFLAESLQLYSYVLIWAVANSGKKREDFVFLDYGGGSGILCLLAKELGLGKVIYTDIYDVSLNDARKLGQHLGLEADDYVLGDVDDTLDFLKQQDIDCDTVATHDVIEHIYDVEDFFEKLPLFSRKKMSIVMLTVANPYNPRLAGRLKGIQRKLEYTDREPEWWHKGRDSLKSYLAIRRKMIAEYLKEKGKSVSDEHLEVLARNSRGKMSHDIYALVDQYLTSGKLPPAPAHPTNTCDPVTGNRAENLVDPRPLAKILQSADFETEIRGGYYWRSPGIVKRIAGRILNWLITNTGFRGLTFSTTLLIYGIRKGKRK